MSWTAALWNGAKFSPGKTAFFGYEKTPGNGVNSATNQKAGGSSPSWRASSRRTLVVRRIFLRKTRLHRSGWSHLPVRSVLDAPHWGAAPLLSAKSHAAPALFACKRAHDVPACYQLFADFPTFPQPGTGRARRPACSFFSSLLPPDPYLTHTASPWVWVKLWSGYHRIPALGFFLIIAAVPALRPSSSLPPAGRW